MKSIAVYIATTGGPVRIERVTPERAPQSLICLGRSSTILPISGDYDDFVRPGSGIIEREFGPHADGSYRLDLSGAIGSGRSWQLGVFLAHALAAAGRLAPLGDEPPPDEIAVVTGQVDFDLNVDAVDHITQKLISLVKALPDMADRPVSLIVPAGENFDLAARAELPAGVKLVPAATAWDACRALGLAALKGPVGNQALQTSTQPDDGQAQTMAWRSRPWRIGALIGFGVAVLLSTTYAALGPAVDLSRYSQDVKALFAIDDGVKGAPVSAPKPVPPHSDQMQTEQLHPVQLRLLARRPPEGRTCADVQFADVPPILDPVDKNAKGDLLDSQLDAICGLTFEVTAANQGTYVALLLHVRSGKRIRGRQPPPALSGAVVLSGVATWSIDLPRHSAKPFVYQLTLIETAQPVGAEMAELRRGQPSVEVLQDLAQRGNRVQTFNHVVRN